MSSVWKFVSAFLCSIIYFGCGVIFNNKAKAPSIYGIFGQTSFTSNARTQGFYLPSGVIKVGNKLVVTDTGNHRVLVYNSVPSSFPATPDLVLGQSGFSSFLPNQGNTSPAANTLSYPTGVASDGTKLIVADTANHRVLIWTTFPTQNGQAADVVLGQSSFSAASPACATNQFQFPTGVWSDGTKLYIADTSNARVLIFNSIPTSLGTTADFVLGQIDLVTCATGSPANSMRTPTGIYTQGGNLFVADQFNNRVNIWTGPITVNKQASNRVIGQTTTASVTNYSASPSLSTTFRPLSVTGDGTRIIVGDAGDNRILIWNSLPVTDGVAADIVLGQSSGSFNGPNPGGLNGTSLSTYNFANPEPKPFVYSDGASLFATDTNNNRVLIWNSIPTNTNTSADKVLGQIDFNHGLPGGLQDGARAITHSSSMQVLGGKLFVTSCGDQAGARFFADNRILGWNLFSTLSALPDFQLGQPSWYTAVPNAYITLSSTSSSSKGYFCPQGVAYDGSQFYVVDSANYRVLIYSSLPSDNTAAPTGVLGQSSMSTNSSATTATGLNFPTDAVVANSSLFVSDQNNSRVLVWNPLPSAGTFATPATFVLGQSTMTSGTANLGGSTTAQTLSRPRSVVTDGVRLLVADTGNNRVLIWNTLPTTTQQAADLVLGQPDMSSSSCNLGSSAPTANTLCSPRGIWTDGKTLAVADVSNHRVLLWKQFPTSNNASADWVFGQPDFVSKTPNNGGMSEHSLYLPLSVLVYGGILYIGDAGNSRILSMPFP